MTLIKNYNNLIDLNNENEKRFLIKDFNQNFYFTIEKNKDYYSFIFILPNIEANNTTTSFKELELTMEWWQENSSYNYQINGIKSINFNINTDYVLSLMHGDTLDIKSYVETKGLHDNKIFCKFHSIYEHSFVDFIKNCINTYINPHLKKMGINKNEQIYLDINDRFKDLIKAIENNKTFSPFLNNVQLKELNQTISNYESIRLNSSLEISLTPYNEDKKRPKI